jgi:hypothetical protein
MLEIGLFEGAGAEDLTQLVEADLFANVELDQNEDRPAQRGLCRLPRHALGLGKLKDDFGVQSHKNLLSSRS